MKRVASRARHLNRDSHHINISIYPWDKKWWAVVDHFPYPFHFVLTCPILEPSLTKTNQGTDRQGMLKGGVTIILKVEGHLGIVGRPTGRHKVTRKMWDGLARSFKSH